MSYFKTNKEYLTSILYDYNLYFDSDRTIDTVSQDGVKLIQHVKSKEEYYIVIISDNMLIQKKDNLYRIIAYPANNSFFWPIDVVKSEIDNQYYFVYPCRFKASRIALSELSKDENFLGVEKDYIKLLLLNIVEAFQSLRDIGYIYYIWDDNIIYCSINDYSILMPFSNKISLGLNTSRKLSIDEYHTEFIDPYVYANKCKYDYQSEMYILAALIFRLLIGRFPFEGSLMDGIPKDTEFEFQQWVQKYTSQPIFMFDKNDTRNAIGTFSNEEIFIDRWNQLPEKLKDMFCSFFEEDNIMRKRNVLTTYLPKDWKEALLLI